METPVSIRNTPVTEDDSKNDVDLTPGAPGQVLNPVSRLDNEQYGATLLLESFAAARRQRTAANPFEMLGVVFRNMSVYGYETSTDYQPTFGNYPQRVLSTFLSGGRKRVTILNGFDGLVDKGEMLLVLGRPGSGCSTLLKTIAGVKHGLQITDDLDLSYNGASSQSKHKICRGECIYNAESDTHFPELTVRQTLVFAAEARGSHDLMLEKVEGSKSDYLADAVLSMFNLSHVANSKVGDELLRGISGGERRRLSIAEAFIGGSPLQCWDNSTRGLDSATALTITQLLKNSTRISGSTALMAVYQASQPLYELFDKVTLLYEGRQIYFGPILAAKQYFLDMGFICTELTTTSDFLTSLTNPAQHQIREGYEHRVPRTPEEFEQMWKISSPRRQLLEAIVDNQQRSGMVGKDLQTGGERTIYKTAFSKQILICVVRGLQRLRQNLAVPISGIIGTAVLGTITGSVFYNLDIGTSSFYGRGALIFFATMINATSSAFEVLTMWSQRPIVERHTRYAFYHPSAEAIASMICDLPNKLLTSLFFNVILYFMTNLRREPSAFLTFYLFSFACLLTMSMFFRMVGLLSKTHAQAMAPVALWILNLILTIGFVLPNREMKPWLRWIGYINPMAFTFESLMINEFNNRSFRCSTLLPTGPGYENPSKGGVVCATVGVESEGSYVDGGAYLLLNYGFRPTHLWRNLGFILAFMAFFLLAHVLAAEYVSGQPSKGDVVLFRRRRREDEVSALDIEKNLPIVGSSGSSNSSKWQSGESGLAVSSSTTVQDTYFTWNDLSYDVRIGGKPQRLLDDVDGWVQAGSLTALMGATGAGKTTLLDVLANRVSIGTVTGDVFVNYESRDESFQRETGYVQQNDIHIPTSTVREALQFSATLRQPSENSLQEKLNHVEDVISTLEMDSYAEAVIGTAGDGLNIEQRKRLSIAVELAAKPALLLFLDEPTSGLDSETAWSTCQLLRKLADNGQAILCTIHQPSASLFQKFDRLLLLGNGGKTLYFGDIGADATILKDYFQKEGARPCLSEENPAEWLLNITGSNTGSVTAAASATDWSSVWNKSLEKHQVKDRLSITNMQQSTARLLKQGNAEGEYAASFLVQLGAVTRRNLEQDWRTPSYLYSKFMISIGTALFIGFSFWMSPASIQGLQDQIFAIFLLMVIFSNVTQLIVEKFVRSRALFEAREQPSKTYSRRVFLLSAILAEIPSQTIIALLVFVCWYFPTGMYRNAGLHAGERGTLMFLFIWSFCMFTSTFSHLIVAGIPEAGAAVNVAQLLYLLSLIFCGVLVQPKDMPNFWSFMNRVSPLTYLIGGMTVVGLGNTPVACAPLEILRMQAPTGEICGEYLQPYVNMAGGQVLNPNDFGSCQFCPAARTDDILSAMGFKYTDRWRDLGIVLAHVVVDAVGAYLIFWLLRKKVSRST